MKDRRDEIQGFATSVKARKWKKSLTSNVRAKVRHKVSQEKGHKCALPECGCEIMLILVRHPHCGDFLLCDLCDLVMRKISGWESVDDYDRLMRAILRLHELAAEGVVIL